MIKKGILASVLIGLALAGCAAPSADFEIIESIPVQPVWSAVKVSFALETVGGRQFVAFYDANRQMVVGQRSLNSKKWTFQKLPEFLGWDGHNSIAMTLDDDGCIHVSGNMHGAPLIYFRSEKPYDVASLKPVGSMIGENELKCTYPRFLRGTNGALVFTYRDGSSGSGNQIYNVYDLQTKTWKRLLDRPLADGQGLMNAYVKEPVLGADGYFHITWIWRDTPDCSTNHDLCYARSKDLIHWETADGRSIELPIRLDTPGVLVDPVPVKGGMLNGNGLVGFDSSNRVILAYHKFDKNGNTQLYNARFEDGAWKSHQTSDWNSRWYFEGNGGIDNQIQISPVVVENGKLTQDFYNKVEGSGSFVLDEATLKPVATKSAKRLPEEMRRVRSTFPEMRVKLQQDNTPPDGLVKYVLRWETLPPFRDLPRPEPWPEPGMLEVYELKIINQPSLSSW